MPEAFHLFEAFFERSDAVVYLCLDEDFIITHHNPFFARLISSENGYVGRELSSFLLPESASFLRASDITETGTRVPLNFRAGDSSTFNLKALVFGVEEGYVIFAENMSITNDDIFKKMTEMTNEITNMARELRRKNRELVDARDKINTLSGIIPICCHCKEIRDDKGYWNNLEKFISDHSEALFSHSICETCMKKHYPEIFSEPEDEKNEEDK